MIMLSPIAIGYYMDTLQKGRYRKVFGVVESIAFLNALICSALHILGIADYIETLPVAPCDPCRQRSDWVHYDGL